MDDGEATRDHRDLLNRTLVLVYQEGWGMSRGRREAGGALGAAGYTTSAYRLTSRSTRQMRAASRRAAASNSGLAM